jgi:hypothetical protein
MCGQRRAMLVSVMDGHRPQIRCEGRWHAPYIAAPYDAAVGVDRTTVSQGVASGVRDQERCEVAKVKVPR